LIACYAMHYLAFVAAQRLFSGLTALQRSTLDCIEVRYINTSLPRKIVALLVIGTNLLTIPQPT
jgi:hypothetical protein